MKKIFIAMLLMASLSFSANACDICGCSVSNYNPFFFPHLAKRSVSLNYLHRTYHINSDEGINVASIHSFLVGAQISIHKRWQLITMVPYQANALTTGPGKKNIAGLGDISLLANYKLWERITKQNRQTLQIGGGVKLPTGTYREAKTDDISNQNFQLGSGSLDYLLNASYRLSFRKWIVSGAASYKYNSSNSQHFRFGDVVTTGITMAYHKDWEKLSFVPYLQATNESQLKDANDHLIQNHSGGSILYTGLGLDVNTQRITLGCSYQFAASQSLAQGEIISKPRISAHVSFNF